MTATTDRQEFPKQDYPSRRDGEGGGGSPFPRSERSGDSKPMEVRVEGDNINRAINQLKRKMANEGIYKELKKRRFYEKPSERKKRKQREAERRLRKAQRRAVPA